MVPLDPHPGEYAVLVRESKLRRGSFEQETATYRAGYKAPTFVGQAAAS